MPDICTVYRINDRNLALRREFLGLSRSDIAVLALMRGWARWASPRIARKFYDVQFGFEPTRKFFEQIAKRKGVDLGALREQLERTQAQYLLEIFEEAAKPDPFGPEYFEKRLKIGLLHNKIDLPLKWYLGSYAIYHSLCTRSLAMLLFWMPPLLRKVEHALFKVFNYDSQAVTEGYLVDLCVSFGTDVRELGTIPEDQDLAEQMPKVKAQMLALCDALDLLSRGDLSSRLETRLDTGLAHKFNTAVEKITELMQDARTISREVEDNVTETLRHLESLSSRSTAGRSDIDGSVREVLEQLQQAVEEVAQGSEQTARAASKGVDSVREIVSAVQEVAVKLEAADEAASRVGETAEGGRRGLAESSESLKQIESETQALSTQLNGLVELSGSIARILGGIEDIADQTNLLALNAAIEAARAGDHGRGFAVVADEVRKLAEQSAASTQEVRQIISRITQQAQHSAEAMDRNLVAVSDGVRKSLEVGESLLEILTAVNLIAEQVREASDKGKESTSSADVAMSEIEQIAAIAEESSAASQEMTAASVSALGNTLQVADQLGSSAGKLRGAADRLRFSLGMFVIGTEGSESPAGKIKVFLRAHEGWMDAVEGMISRGLAVADHELDSHKTCSLGRWYYGFGVNSFGSLPEFRSVEAPHVRAHELAREARKLCQSGKASKAQSLLPEIRRANSEVCAKLEALHQAASREETRSTRRKAA